MTADTLVILPTYNEKDNLEAAVGGVREAGYDVLVVDDNSPDGTGRIADRLAAADKGVTVLHRSGKLGLGSAYVDAFKLGLGRGYGLLVEMDADGSHRVEHLPAIVAAARANGGIGRRGQRLGLAPPLPELGRQRILPRAARARHP